LHRVRCVLLRSLSGASGWYHGRYSMRSPTVASSCTRRAAHSRARRSRSRSCAHTAPKLNRCRRRVGRASLPCRPRVVAVSAARRCRVGRALLPCRPREASHNVPTDRELQQCNAAENRIDGAAHGESALGHCATQTDGDYYERRSRLRTVGCSSARMGRC
jgi:hypothetical protein